MVFSQTGFGRASVQTDELVCEIELKSVNSRFFELAVHLPRSLSSYENEIRKAVQKRVQRGKVFLRIQESRASWKLNQLDLDESSTEKLLSRLRELGKKFDLEDDLALSHILGAVDLLSADEDRSISSGKMKSLLSGVDSAIDEFEKMRQQEGENLAEDLKQRVQVILDQVDIINKASGENREEQFKKLKERIETYIPKDSVDLGRLEQEVALMVDRLDITEELVRLKSHTTQFGEALENGGEIGKRLNFLLQEMNRESNTIGSKSGTSEVSTSVVTIKEELEKLREQVQNIV